MHKKGLSKIILINISLVFFILGILEILARIFSNAILFGNSKHLFDTSNKNYITNCKSCEAVSFGQKVFTDEYGFRASSLIKINSQIIKEKVIIIGDSVAFGPGVKFKNTFQGLLESDFTEYSFINRSVMGHSLDQHLQTANLISKDIENIKKVYLIYCLNDLSNISNYEISKSLNLNEKDSAWISKIKENKFFSFINEPLRNKSILYMQIKGVMSKPQERYFFSDFNNYLLDIDQLNIKNLRKISEIFKKQNIELVVIVSPYEYQVRNAKNNNIVLLPQRFLKEFFEKNQISYIDSYPQFLNSDFKSSDLFLPYDPMHLSEKGHEILFQIIKKDLTN